MIRTHFKLTPKGIIESLDLRRPISESLCGQLGRELPGFTWERTDKAEILRKAVGQSAVRVLELEYKKTEPPLSEVISAGLLY